MTGPSVLAALSSLQGPAPGLAAGSGMLSALAGRPGANPYLQQHAVAQQGSLDQINSLRVAQQHDQAALIHQQQLQERMRQLALKRDDAARQVTKDILFGAHAIEDENVRKPFVDQYAKSLGGLGIAVPDSMKAVWAKGGPSQESQKNLAIQLAAADAELDPNSKGMLEAQAQKYYLDHGGNPQDWSVVSQNLRSDAYLKAVGQPTKAQNRLDALKLQKEEAAAIAAKYPELTKGKPEVIQDMIMQHRKYNHGQAYTEGTPESQELAYSIAKYNEAQREEDKLNRQIQMQERLRASSQEFQMMMQDKRFAQQDKLLQDRLAAQQQSVAKQKQEAMVASTKSFMAQFKALIPQLDTEGFLPKDEGILSSKWAATQRWARPENEVLRQWNELQSSFIGFSRGIQNDVVRAMAAQLEAARVNSSPPTRKGLELIWNNMNSLVKAIETGQPQPAPNAGPSPLTPTAPAQGWGKAERVK